MMREPWFWRSKSLTARIVSQAISPLSFAYDAAQRTRWNLTHPHKPPAPVICIGNASLGGEGKTPFAIMLGEMLEREGVNYCFLTRGYGGRLPGPVHIDASKHSVADVGDEALLLSRNAPTWTARDRIAGAQAAAENGVDVILMDDGFQNPKLAKTLSILLFGGDATIGNGRVFPAGPLREPFARALARADLVVFTGDDPDAGIAKGKPTIRAKLEPINPPPPQKIVAFSGIGKPQKFFALLAETGFDVAAKVDFPDHHFFTEHQINALRSLAKKNKATLITTEKDFVRLSDEMQEDILTFPIAMRVDKPEILRRLVLQSINDTEE